VLIFHHHATALNIVSYFYFLGTNLSIVLDAKEKCDHEDQKTKVFVDAEFLQPDDADTVDDQSWFRWNDSYVPMPAIMQPTNSYVYNLSISPGDIPNVSEAFRWRRKRMTVANANDIGKLSCVISVDVICSQQMFYTMYDTHNA
jgi:hypothetical protein